MNKYVNVFWFNVIDKLKDGNEIFVIDRELHEVFVVGSLPVKTLAGIFSQCEDEKEYIGRYEFYYIAEEENKEDESGI